MRSEAQIERKDWGCFLLLNGYSPIEVAEACDVSLATAEWWERHCLPPPEPVPMAVLMSVAQAWDSDDIDAPRRTA